MRTLKLSHSQISLLQLALGLAEKQCSDLFKQIIEATAVRENDNKGEEREHAKYYYKKSCKFADFNSDLQNGEFDVQLM